MEVGNITTNKSKHPAIITINSSDGLFVQTTLQTIEKCPKLLALLDEKNNCINTDLPLITVKLFVDYLRGYYSQRVLYDVPKEAMSFGLLKNDIEYVMVNVGGKLFYLHQKNLAKKLPYFEKFFEKNCELHPDYSSILVDRSSTVFSKVVSYVTTSSPVKKKIMMTSGLLKDLDYYSYFDADDIAYIKYNPHMAHLNKNEIYGECFSYLTNTLRIYENKKLDLTRNPIKNDTLHTSDSAELEFIVIYLGATDDTNNIIMESDDSSGDEGPPVMDIDKLNKESNPIYEVKIDGNNIHTKNITYDRHHKKLCIKIEKIPSDPYYYKKRVKKSIHRNLSIKLDNSHTIKNMYEISHVTETSLVPSYTLYRDRIRGTEIKVNCDGDTAVIDLNSLLNSFTIFFIRKITFLSEKNYNIKYIEIKNGDRTAAIISGINLLHRGNYRIYLFDKYIHLYYNLSKNDNIKIYIYFDKKIKQTIDLELDGTFFTFIEPDVLQTKSDDDDDHFFEINNQSDDDDGNDDDSDEKTNAKDIVGDVTAADTDTTTED